MHLADCPTIKRARIVEWFDTNHLYDIRDTWWCDVCLKSAVAADALAATKRALRDLERESINKWIKERLQGKKSRAPAVGARRQHFSLLCAALYNNFAALLAHRDRLKQQAA